ncbi:MAG TPA: TetR/AcrR family transcriptional regulator [Acidimicrobiales bacterium]|nr:TetR/AcrR family transcriptional regulator [Acidimicrobiales bacterium]
MAESAVPAEQTAPLALRSVERALARRYSAYAEEVERLIRAGVAVMRRGGGAEPRVGDIVAEAGLSNQAFYRHFRSKDELLMAILDDGQRQLVSYLRHQMAKEAAPAGKVRRWVEGIMAQAADPAAAENTRAVVANTDRVKHRFPVELTGADEVICAPLRQVLEEAGSTDPGRDAQAIYRMVMASMHACLIRQAPPTRRDVDHLVAFALAGAGLESSPAARGGRRGA